MQPGFSSEIVCVCVSVRTQIKGHPGGVFPYNYGQQFDYHNHGMCIPAQGPCQVHTHAHILKVFPKYYHISVTLLPDDWDHLCVSHKHTHTHQWRTCTSLGPCCKRMWLQSPAWLHERIQTQAQVRPPLQSHISCGRLYVETQWNQTYTWSSPGPAAFLPPHHLILFMHSYTHRDICVLLCHHFSVIANTDLVIKPGSASTCLSACVQTRSCFWFHPLRSCCTHSWNRWFWSVLCNCREQF